MKYQKVIPAIFVSRPNRFIAKVRIAEDENGVAAGADRRQSAAETNAPLEMVHVKNTGRCRELLVPGCRVYLAESDNTERKTKYDLVAVEKNAAWLTGPDVEGGLDGLSGSTEAGLVEPSGNTEAGSGTLLINMDSQAPNDAAEEWLNAGGNGLFSESAIVRREVTFGSSRFDFYLEDGERKAFLEVKGCTLEEGGIARFPDAPTERGVKHVEELEKALADGYEAYLLIVIQMKPMKEFRPNDETHKAFGDALRHAAKTGVKILAYDCLVTPDSMTIDAPVPVGLEY